MISSNFLVKNLIDSPKREENGIIRHLFLCLLICGLGATVGCADLGTGPDEERSERKTSSDGWGGDPLYDESSYDEPLWGDESTGGEIDPIVSDFLAQELPRSEDTSPDALLYAGPGYGPDVALACAQGTLYVAAGVATGALASAFAVLAVPSGPGAAALAPSSAGLFMVAGGMIGLGGSLASWGSCVVPVARLGMELIWNGYARVAGDLQGLVLQINAALSRPQADANTGTRTRTCSRSQCANMTRRYHQNFCDPLDQWRGDFDLHALDGTRLCEAAAGFLNCQDFESLIDLAAGCYKGRRAVSDRCHPGDLDHGHATAMRIAEQDLNICLDFFQRAGCGDRRSMRNDAFKRGEEAFPECR
ncbi:MAG: hypothetical protein VYD19_03900 [Myxococcota bacterium]|nr:hypothetical protein [Myxococcota bacterium]